ARMLPCGRWRIGGPCVAVPGRGMCWIMALAAPLRGGLSAISRFSPAARTSRCGISGVVLSSRFATQDCYVFYFSRNDALSHVLALYRVPDREVAHDGTGKTFQINRTSG